jgi:L-alanine-DL-glutamate epimerase-like enolase superfamily enzyme
MKPETIKSVRVRRAVSSLSRPIADSTHSINEIAFIVMEVTTAAGVSGEGYLLSFDYSPAGIRGAIEDLVPLLDGTPVYETGELSRRASERAEYFGFTGLQKQAVALANVAMWDAWAERCMSASPTPKEPSWFTRICELIRSPSNALSSPTARTSR